MQVRQPIQGGLRFEPLAIFDRRISRIEPRGWDVVRLPVHDEEKPAPAQADDLEALANAVREAALPQSGAEPVGQGIEVGRRGHLRVLRSSPADKA